MKISDIYTSKGLKFKLTYLDASARFSVGALVSIESTQNDKARQQSRFKHLYVCEIRL